VDEQQAKLQAMEKEKGEKIAKYMSLQDEADRLNEEIYKVCCDVETLNARIDALKAEIHRANLAKTVK
jgi:peptidoglycan hydrolase CwlO-like protein